MSDKEMVVRLVVEKPCTLFTFHLEICTSNLALRDFCAERFISLEPQTQVTARVWQEIEMGEASAKLDNKRQRLVMWRVHDPPSGGSCCGQRTVGLVLTKSLSFQEMLGT